MNNFMQMNPLSLFAGSDFMNMTVNQLQQMDPVDSGDSYEALENIFGDLRVSEILQSFTSGNMSILD